MNYSVEGVVMIRVAVEVFADDEQSAKLLAKNALNDCYHLDTNRAYHNVEHGVEFDLDAFDEDDN